MFFPLFLDSPFVFYSFLLCFFPFWISIEYFLFFIAFICGSLFYFCAFLIRIERITCLLLVYVCFLCFFGFLSVIWLCSLSLYILDWMYYDFCFYLPFYILSLQLFSLIFFFPLFLFPFFPLPPPPKVIFLVFRRW